MEENTNTGVVESTTEKTYTQAEVNELLQKEADRRVSEALKKQEKKNADKVKEAQRLAQMNEQEKYVYELEQREKTIAEKERQLALAENKNQASKILADKGIDISLTDLVLAEDAETMNTNINLLEKAFKKSVKAEVEKRLGSQTPKKNLPLEQEITKDRFKTMSLAEKTRLMTDNPEIYKQLKGD